MVQQVYEIKNNIYLLVNTYEVLKFDEHLHAYEVSAVIDMHDNIKQTLIHVNKVLRSSPFIFVKKKKNVTLYRDMLCKETICI